MLGWHIQSLPTKNQKITGVTSHELSCEKGLFPLTQTTLLVNMRLFIDEQTKHARSLLVQAVRTLRNDSVKGSFKQR